MNNEQIPLKRKQEILSAIKILLPNLEIIHTQNQKPSREQLKIAIIIALIDIFGRSGLDVLDYGENRKYYIKFRDYDDDDDEIDDDEIFDVEARVFVNSGGDMNCLTSGYMKKISQRLEMFEDDARLWTGTDHPYFHFLIESEKALELYNHYYPIYGNKWHEWKNNIRERK